MSLRLLLGRAGTGKTHRCLGEICAAAQEDPWGPPLLLIAPDQATFAMERELAHRGGGLGVQVYSFKRLAYQVLRETGGAALLPVSELGRRMMLKNILIREKKRLGLMGGLQNRPGFLVSLSELISELKTCRVAPRDLEGVLAGFDKNHTDLLGLKLKDLQLVYRKLQEHLVGRFTDPDDYLDLLVQKLPTTTHLAGARVWVDGFASFTPQECAVLGALLSICRQVTVTLCLDQAATRGQLPRHHPLQQPLGAYLRLGRLAREGGTAVQEEFLPFPGPRFTAPELAHLEKHFFTYPTRVYSGPVTGLHLAAGVNVRADVEGVVRQIRHLLRESGLRPRQIMVAVREVDIYFPLLRRALADHEIPFFVDHRRPVLHHPLVELLRSALEVWRTGWSYDPVFRYLKTGLTRLDRAEVDKLENYVLAAGIRGSTWYQSQPWRFVPGSLWSGAAASDDTADQELPAALEIINDIRCRGVQELRAAQLRVRDQATARPARLTGRQWAQVLVELCLELDLPRRLAKWGQEAQEQGLPELEREHRQVWRLVSNLWDQLVEVLGAEYLTLAEFSAVVEAGLEAASLALIPPGLDAVTVGSLERSRPPRDVRALFLPGLTEGALPSRLRLYGVLTEREREQLSRRLAEHNLDLAPGVRDRLQEEQFLIYRSLTRTGELLYLSYPLGDDEGRAVTPSTVIRRVRELFPALTEEQVLVDPPGDGRDVKFVEHPTGLLPRLAQSWQAAARGRRVHPLWWRVYNLLLAQEQWRDHLHILVTGLTGRNYESPLDPELGAGIWTRTVRGRRIIPASVSRLERFINCPFAHFLAYGLGLEERTVYGLAPPDTGQLYHEALRQFVGQVAEGVGWDRLQEDQVPALCTRVVEKLAPRLQGRILLSSPRLNRQKDRLLERVTDSARALVRQIQGSGFRPAALEVYFGPRGRDAAPPRTITAGAVPYWPDLVLPPLEINLGRDLVISLSGRIDRVDLAPAGAGFYLRVIDYKTGAEKLELPRVLAGVQLQLLVYLWTILKHLAKVGDIDSLKPAGALYFQVQKPLLSVPGPELQPSLLQREWLKRFKLTGWLVDDGEELYHLLDSNLEPGAHGSPLVPLALTKKGQPYGSYAHSIYTVAEWRWLLRAVMRLVQKAGLDLARGRVDIAPLKIGNRTACDYCPYAPVCRFDPGLPENRYRSLSLDAKELRQQVGRAAAQGEEDCFVFYQLDN